MTTLVENTQLGCNAHQIVTIKKYCLSFYISSRNTSEIGTEIMLVFKSW